MTQQSLEDKLESETGYLHWRELEKYYASGNIRLISTHCSLIDTAILIVNDDVKQIKKALLDNRIIKPDTVMVKK